MRKIERLKLKQRDPSLFRVKSVCDRLIVLIEFIKHPFKQAHGDLVCCAGTVTHGVERILRCDAGREAPLPADLHRFGQVHQDG